ncbi:MAG: class I SAM-dependent methyltransferase [Lentisphaeraceae bacterium]|nr:class I SAM-dependent methyltransferase [Lentisphaeraceae bacterium]
METVSVDVDDSLGPQPVPLIASQEEVTDFSENQELATYTFFTPKKYLGGPWSGHLSFANLLVKEMKPELFVELGSHWGESYFTFCQSVLESGLDARCYAVDTWEGDDQAGNYGEEVFTSVNDYNKKNYQSFSYLLRSTFDESLSKFGDETIDLLHIDGLHTYEAVKHDFETWSPKVKPGGVILFHDVCARHDDFGVWKLWEEIKGSAEQHFLFSHSWGLGVWRKPGGSELTSKVMSELFANRGRAIVRDSVLMSSALLTAKQHIINFERALEVSRDDERHLRAESERLLADLKILLSQKKDLEQKLTDEQANLARVTEEFKRSLSWKITKPLRALKGIFK